MDDRLRTIERRFQADPSFGNKEAYVRELIRIGEFFEALRLATPSRLMQNGFLLIRLKKKHIAVSPQLDYFDVSQDITAAMRGFALTDNEAAQIIGQSYPLDLPNPELDEVVLLAHYNVHDAGDQLNSETRSLLVNDIVSIAHEYLEPLSQLELALRLAKQKKSPQFMIDQTRSLAAGLDIRRQLALGIIACNDIYFDHLLQQCSRNYAEIRNLNPTISLKLTQEAGEDRYFVKIDGRTIPLPKFFQRTDFIAASAVLPIPNYYLNFIEGDAYFYIRQDIDYDFITATVGGLSATTPIGGNRYMPNEPQLRQLNLSQYYDDEGATPIFEQDIKPWHVGRVLGELAALAENIDNEAYEGITNSQYGQLADNLFSVTQAWDYDYPRNQLGINQFMVSRDYESESYPNTPNCRPCYMFEVETFSGDTFYTNTDEIYAALKKRGLIGIHSPTTFSRVVLENLDFSNPSYWLPI